MLPLREYQWQMVKHIIDHPRCNLFASMGTGKTVSTATAVSTLMLLEDVAPVLILGPLRVVTSVWPEEIAKWEHLRHLRVSVVVGDAKERTLALCKPADVYCINYDNLEWLVDHLGDRWPFKMVIADECSKLKGFRLRQGTRRARALSRYVHRSPRYVGLTGTPAANGLQDLWAISWMVDRGQRLGRTFEAFKSRWFRTIQVGADRHAIKLEPLPYAQEQIQAALADITLALDARDWFDLREPIVNDIMVELPPAAKKLYRAMERQMYVELAGGDAVEAFDAASRTMKCLQLANGAIYTDDTGAWAEVHEAKLEALEEVIEEAAGMPVLVAYHFKSDLARLKRRFPRGRELDKKPATIDDWNAGRIPVLFAHPASAGHGLSLQHGGNIICMFGHNWNLEERMQILERIGPTRQMQSGYDRPVFIHNIIARGTIDELVLQRVQTKASVQEILLGAMKRAA